MPTTLPPLYSVPDWSEGLYFQSGSSSGLLKRIRSDGTLAWTDTIKFCPNSGCGGVWGIVPDPVGGIIGMWSLKAGSPGISFHMQRVDSTGQLLWGTGGIMVYDSPFEVEAAANPVIPLVSDGRGGAIVSWILNAQGFRIFIKQVSANGIMGEVTTGLKEISISPHQFILLQNYPNPFNSATQISYTLPKAYDVDLSVYDILGRKVATLVSQKQLQGEHQANFDASSLASGIYVYRLQINRSKAYSQKMLIIN